MDETIRTDLDELYTQYKKMQILTDKLKRDLIEKCRLMKSNEAVSEFVYTKMGAIPNRDNIVLLAHKYNLAIPYQPVKQPEVDYKQLMLYLEDVELEGDDLKLLYKPKADSIGKKRGA